MQMKEIYTSSLNPDLKAKFLKASEGLIVGEENGALMRMGRAPHHLMSFAFNQNVREDRVVLPNLFTHPGSVAVLSAGPDVVNLTQNFRSTVLNQDVFVFDPYGLSPYPSISLNLLDTLTPSEPAFIKKARRLADALLQSEFDTHKLSPSLWGNASDLLTALLVAVTTAPSSEFSPEMKNLNTCARLVFAYGKSEWNNFASRLECDCGPFDGLLNLVGRQHCENKELPRTPEIADAVRRALRFALSFPLKNHLETSSFPLAVLGNGNRKATVLAPRKPIKHASLNKLTASIFGEKQPRRRTETIWKATSLYVVMPTGQIKNNAPWLRSLFDTISACCFPLKGSPNLLAPEDRLLFLIDKVDDLSPFTPFLFPEMQGKGITFWGTSAAPKRAHELQKLRSFHIQDLDFIDSSGNRVPAQSDKRVLQAVLSHNRDMPYRPRLQRSTDPRLEAA
jgi:hypothetical protein